MIAFRTAATESSLAEPLIAKTESRLRADIAPIWVSDGLDAYGAALFKRHHQVVTFPRTGKLGRPRTPKLVACPELRYGQVVKQRDENMHLVSVRKRSVYGDVPLHRILTVYIERQNLNIRHENRRFTRKTCAFSKAHPWLEAQLHLYQAYFNFARKHRGLYLKQQRMSRSPAMAAGVTQRVWSLEELMCLKTYINH